MMEDVGWSLKPSTLVDVVDQLDNPVNARYMAANFTTAFDTAAEVAGYAGQATAALRAMQDQVNERSNVYDSEAGVLAAAQSLSFHPAAGAAPVTLVGVGHDVGESTWI